MHRRTLLRSAAALPLIGAAMPTCAADSAGTPFDANTVRGLAQGLASKPFQAQETALPAFLNDLSYDQYRDLRFNKAQAVWRDSKLPWQIEFFHRG